MKFQIAPKSTEIQANWGNARLYCFSLNIDGKIGWRLPNKEELNEIYQSRNDFENLWYWSSTEYTGNYAWFQNVTNGTQGSYNKFYSLYIRAIRSTV